MTTRGHHGLLLNAGGGGGGGDPDFATVISLLNAAGADGSTTITDVKGKTWTPTGDTQIDTSLGYNSILFDGNDRASTPDATDWDFGSGLWTIEIWLYPNSVTGFQNLIGKRAGFNFAPFTMALDGDKLRTRCSENSVAWQVDQTSSIALSNNTLVHVAAVRDTSDVFRQYVGGVQSGTGTFTGSLMTNLDSVYIGAQSDSAGGYTGHIVAVRANKGACRYPGGTSFTPPSPPFPES